MQIIACCRSKMRNFARIYALIRNERNRRNELVEEPEQHTVNTSEKEKKRMREIVV